MTPLADATHSSGTAAEALRTNHVKAWAFNCGVMLIIAAFIWFISAGDEHRLAVYNALIFIACAVAALGAGSFLAYRSDLRRAGEDEPL